MKKHFYLFVMATMAITSSAYAQYASDALRFSQTNFGGTARFKGIGNAQTGVGGDLGSISANPAGLGLFTKSEFSLTPEFNNVQSDALYLNQNTSSTKSQLNLNNIGFAWYNPSYVQKGKNTKTGLLSTVLAFGYTRNNDFSNSFSYAGQNATNSIRDYFAELANNSKDGSNNIAPGTLEEMAYNGYLINFNTPGNANNYTANPFIGSNKQTKNETRLGSTSEVNFSGSMNFSNQFYIGAGIGLANIRYTSDAEYIENGVLNPYDNSSNTFTGNENYALSFRQNQDTKGSGINLKVGAIFRPEPNFRVGITFQTPTWFLIEDNYSEGLSNKLSNDNFNNKANTYNFTYRLSTPLKGSLGSSYIIGGKALISADVDFIDYASMRFSTADGNDPAIISDNNNDVRNNYKSAINYRFGGEYKLDKVSLRAGYGVYGSPYKGDNNGTFDTQYYTSGIGYRVNQYYFDLAYQHMQNSSDLSPYTLNNFSEPIANIKTVRNNVFLTFGVRF